MVEEGESIVTVTKKGQATIPKALRKKHRIGKKVLVIDTEEGVLIKPVQDPYMEKGSLKALFEDRTSRELVEEAQLEEIKKDRRSLLKEGGKDRQ
ncbi:looped-hinge helix DNA binding domain, AbrB family [Candidatus Nitrososphaera evergladensis SR1]|uniref:Looped-hinge helix DNA binding domain, AbrB family n=1 Tax=Candidatus Nitrososphaera evergladensis SR1 TaxID=1459636 RepID=A0A075MLK0_9ARCH|nr:AbrB/MazE/SpoVT family DNA-binding domain-containing protein [Candidatus Nitrososphaera evergladensis]AIF82341.1 looped-hinge helix DNA binding domain, AbrB family [Candidatus Nitrososphaera evergladensis SR1]